MVSADRCMAVAVAVTAVAGGWALAAQPAAAQLEPVVLWQVDGQEPSVWRGWRVAAAGDVNGDGFADVIVGGNAGNHASVHSGVDGSLLYRFDGDEGFSMGSAVGGAGDVNGDGFDDVIVAAPCADPGGVRLAGSVLVYSGADGTLLHRFDGEGELWLLGYQAVTGVGDIDGDGVPDLLAGSLGAGPGGSVFVYSGADGSQLYRFGYDDDPSLRGWSASGTGDVNGDGFADVTVGAPGSAFVYSGADGSLLFRFDGTLTERFGHPVAGAGDVNGDGYADVIVGAPYASPGGVGYAGTAFVYSGADGSELFHFDGTAPVGILGWWCSGAGDVNGDGRDDVIVGAPGADPGGVDNAGTVFVVGMVSTDTTPPTVVITSPPEDAVYYLGEEIIFEFSAQDDESGLALVIGELDDRMGEITSGTVLTDVALGERLFAVTATDNANNTAFASTVFWVKTAAELIDDLIAFKESLNLHHGIENSLDQSLEAAQDALTAANSEEREDAANKMEAFINHVEAQRDKEITNAEADALIAAALHIIEAIIAGA